MCAYSVRGRVTRACSTARSNVWTPSSDRRSRATPTCDQTCVGRATTSPVRPRHRRRSRVTRTRQEEQVITITVIYQQCCLDQITKQTQIATNIHFLSV